LGGAVRPSTEPGTPHPHQRVNAVRRLSEAGVETGVLVAPVIPGMSDGRAQVQEVVQACRDAGARSVSTIGLHLRPGVREHFMGWLQEARPDLVPLYQRLYGKGSYLPKVAQERLAVVAAESGELRRGFATGHERDPGEPAPPPARE
jgi:DNA repair photolyase